MEHHKHQQNTGSEKMANGKAGGKIGASEYEQIKISPLEVVLTDLRDKLDSCEISIEKLHSRLVMLMVNEVPCEAGWDNAVAIGESTVAAVADNDAEIIKRLTRDIARLDRIDTNVQEISNRLVT